MGGNFNAHSAVEAKMKFWDVATLAWTAYTGDSDHPADSAITQVTSAAADTTLKAANTDRKGLLIYNDSNQPLYIKLGTGAALNSFSVKVLAGGYYELPAPVYTGQVNGIWAGANGNAYVTELSG